MTTPLTIHSIDQIVHIAKIAAGTLFLKPEGEGFRWFLEEKPTPVATETVREAMRQGVRQWRLEGFTPIHCGFLFTHPVRDEVGTPAFFCEMVKSYTSLAGNFFDEVRGHLCVVHNASEEALALFRRLRR